MKKTIKILMLVFAVMFICVGCNNNSIEKHEKRIVESMNSVQEIASTVQVYDSEILVFKEITKTTMLDDGGAEVAKTTSALGSSFTLETSESKNSVSSINRGDLFKLSLKEEFLTNIEFDSEGNLTCEVTSDNFSKVFNSENLKIEGNAKMIFNYIDKKISEVSITFCTVSGKNVSVNVIYSY